MGTLAVCLIFSPTLSLNGTPSKQKHETLRVTLGFQSRKI